MHFKLASKVRGESDEDGIYMNVYIYVYMYVGMLRYFAHQTNERKKQQRMECARTKLYTYNRHIL